MLIRVNTWGGNGKRDGNHQGKKYNQINNMKNTEDDSARKHVHQNIGDDGKYPRTWEVWIWGVVSVGRAVAGVKREG